MRLRKVLPGCVTQRTQQSVVWRVIRRALWRHMAQCLSRDLDKSPVELPLVEPCSIGRPYTSMISRQRWKTNFQNLDRGRSLVALDLYWLPLCSGKALPLGLSSFAAER